MCDFTNGYILSGDSCLRESIENCSLNNYDGGCLFCNTSHFVENGQCLSVLENGGELISGCQVYTTATQCVVCFTGFEVQIVNNV